MNAFLYSDEPRAEELIAEVYRQIVECRAEGREPNRVCMPVHYIRRLRIYHALIGDTRRNEFEYLANDSIFGLEFFIHDDPGIIVS